MGKKTNLGVSLLVGIVLFIIMLRYFGLDSIKLIYQNINPFYFLLYILVSAMTLVTNSFRVQTILKAYKKKVPFFDLFKQAIAGFAVSYITPSARLGGEPLKAYMLKKENGVDLKTGSSAMIIDKFIEVVTILGMGVLGLLILFLVPGVPIQAKAILIGILIFGSGVLFWIYYRTIKKRGSFSRLFILLRFSKIKRWKGFLKTIEEIEKRMHQFFMFNQEEFTTAFLFGGLYYIVNIIEFKLLFLSFGINVSIVEVILTIVVIGIANLIPVPAALGFLEVGQAGLYKLLKNSASVGLAFSLVVRLRNILVTIIGFVIISHFSGKEIIKNSDTKT